MIRPRRPMINNSISPSSLQGVVKQPEIQFISKEDVRSNASVNPKKGRKGGRVEPKEVRRDGAGKDDKRVDLFDSSCSLEKKEEETQAQLGKIRERIGKMLES